MRGTVAVARRARSRPPRRASGTCAAPGRTPSRARKILDRVGLPFIVQTTVGAHNVDELEAIADFAHDELGAKVWNLYFLVPTGRGAVRLGPRPPRSTTTCSPSSARIQRRVRGAACWSTPSARRTTCATLLSSDDADAPFLKTYTGGAGGCPAGTHYMGIRPNGDVTPCPYLPVFGGNLAARASPSCGQLRALRGHPRRARARRPLRRVRAEFHVRRLPRPRLRDDRRRDGRGPALHAHAREFAGSPLWSLATIPRSNTARHAGDIAWDDEARERMKKIPAFVRGMVVKAVEESCRKNGIDRVTVGRARADSRTDADS